jgi:2'-5' RNA ligase
LVAPERAHLTLTFLGDVPRDRLDEVAAAARRAAARRTPFRWTLEGVGAFPGPVRPRVAWVGVGEGSEEIVALQADLTGELRAAGLAPPDERPFAPHVTVARARGRPSGTLPALAFQAPAATVEAVEVTISELRPDGPRYRRVARLKLGA